MTGELMYEVCPETGICSIVRSGAEKVDLMPTDVQTIREAGGAPATVRAVIADCDTAFAAGLSDEEVAGIGKKLA